MKKIFICLMSLGLVLSTFLALPSNRVDAYDKPVVTEGEIVLDLNELKEGDSITVYENPTTGGKLIIDILPAKNSKLNQGTGSWSGGTIPGRTVTMYPHYVDPNRDYSDIGFYETYDGAKQKILETYGASVGCLNGEISEVKTRIITASPTSTVSAKSQLSWMYENRGASLSCYLRHEINKNNQSRLAWRF